VVLHVVGAHARAQQVLRAHAPVRAVIHYFVGDAGLAERYLDLGCLIAVGKPATRPSAAGLHEAVAGIPLDRLLLETDTYPLAGRTTEPRDVADVCSAVARIKGLEPAVVAGQTTENFVRLFGVRAFGSAGGLSRSTPRPT
jgi:TatD DNase family protein